MKSKFVQIHTLTPFAAALLNRDDAGFAKRLPFGGVTRTRISSQCLKRHWRTFDGEGSLEELDLPGTVRSRRTFERYVVAPLIDEGLPEEAVRAVTEALMVEVLGESAKAKRSKEAKSDEDKNDTLQTNQVTVLGQPEIRYLRELVREMAQDLDVQGNKLEKAAKDRVKKALDKDAKANLREMRLGGGVGAALFGRMVTSDVLARADAAIHVAHAFTVHEQDTEDDYFSAIDDLVQEAGEQGSGHINSSELTSGLFYGFVVVDVPLLVSNLTGCKRQDWLEADRAMSAAVVERLVGLVSTVSPGAKLGSTAPYSCAHFVMIEAGTAQPRTLANAFQQPVNTRASVLANTYKRVGEYLSEVDRMYSWSGSRAYAAIDARNALGELGERKSDVASLKSWVREQVMEGVAA